MRVRADDDRSVDLSSVGESELAHDPTRVAHELVRCTAYPINPGVARGAGHYVVETRAIQTCPNARKRKSIVNSVVASSHDAECAMTALWTTLRGACLFPAGQTSRNRAWGVREDWRLERRWRGDGTNPRTESSVLMKGDGTTSIVASMRDQVVAR